MKFVKYFRLGVKFLFMNNSFMVNICSYCLLLAVFSSITIDAVSLISVNYSNDKLDNSLGEKTNEIVIPDDEGKEPDFELLDEEENKIEISDEETDLTDEDKKDNDFGNNKTSSNNKDKPIVNNNYVSSSIVYETEEDKFFTGSVFVGDSVMLGFKNFVVAKGKSFLGGPHFLVAGSLGVRHLIAPDKFHNMLPYYAGGKRPVEDSIKQMGASKVFIALGINDIAPNGVEKTVSNYKTLISRIKLKNPGIKIYIISTTYMAKGSEKPRLNNINIRLLNQNLRQIPDIVFVNIADSLITSEGYIKPAFSSDGYVHLTKKAYGVWVNVLRNFAKEELTKEKNLQMKKDYDEALKYVDLAAKTLSINDYNLALDKVNKLLIEEDKQRLMESLKLVLTKIEQAKKSSNAFLTNLIIGDYSINFDKNKFVYDLTVDYSIDRISIDAFAEDGKASINGLGNFDLNLGLNTLNVVVTAENGDVLKYVLNISRSVSKSSINSLKSIKIDDCDIDLTSLTYQTDADAVAVSVVKEDEKSSVYGDGVINLVNGINEIDIVVTAENGEQKIYKLKIIKNRMSV